MYLEDRDVVDVERWLVGAEQDKVAIDGQTDAADGCSFRKDRLGQNRTG